MSKTTTKKNVALESKDVSETSKFNPHKIIKHLLSTEKSIRMVEFDNKLVFAVDKKASKSDIKKAVETLFKVKVSKVNVQNTITGQKKAYVKIGKEHLASDIGADLGMI
jgi:large subunit ribosomal protein L23